VRVFSWQVVAYLEKRIVGAQVSAVPMSRFCPGRLGALEVERRVRAEAGAWGERDWWRHPGAQLQVADAGSVADCVLLEREGRVSCSIGAVGWCSKRVRALKAAHQVSNSHRFG
jgi:hypothetical protein